MKEQLKSILLALLVLLSLFLTYRLWYGENQNTEIVEDVYEIVFFEEPRTLAAMLTPERIWWNIPEGLYLLRPGNQLFHTVWDDVSLKLQQQRRYEYRSMDTVEDLEPCLRLLFDPLLPVGTGTPWLKGDRSRELREILIWCLEGEIWVSLREPGEAGETALVVSGELSSRKESPGEGEHRHVLLRREILPPDLAAVVSWTEDIYVPAGETVIPPIYLKQELQEKDLLLKTFFVDRSLVRVIKERDGSVIYTDGEKGLRIGDGVEFSDPSRERNQSTHSYLSALGAASNYLCYYGGWPQGLRLESVTLNEAEQFQVLRRRCRVAWTSYSRGLPLLGRGPAAMVTFNDGGLVEYRRLVFQALGQAGDAVIAANVPEVLAAAVRLKRGQEEGGTMAKEHHLESVELAYVIKGPSYQLTAVPAWAVTLDGKRFLLHAAELFPLEEDAQ